MKLYSIRSRQLLAMILVEEAHTDEPDRPTQLPPSARELHRRATFRDSRARGRHMDSVYLARSLLSRSGIGCRNAGVSRELSDQRVVGVEVTNDKVNVLVVGRNFPAD